jgi:hypothetical protein
MSDPTPAPSAPSPRASLNARLEAERHTTLAAREAEYRRQIVEAAGIDPTTLSEQGQRILRWLGQWDDWTTGGIVELLQAARTAAQIAIHADTVDRKRAAFRESVARTDAAIARYDEQWGMGR